MITLLEIYINDLSDYDSLLIYVRSDLVDDEVIRVLKEYVGLRANKVIVEFPYFDNEYLSNYYPHYSQKFKIFSKECCRLHFETATDYLGYITLRPTPGETKMGKTFLYPGAFIHGRAYLMMTKFPAHVLGQKREIECFPWKKQENDISCCAHTATWTILKYFGNKYKNYLDTTIGEIVSRVRNDWGRKTPTMGLNPIQVSDIFKEYGFSPLIIGKNSSDYTVADELLAYVESGLPVVAFLNMEPQNHAISIIGHGEVDLSVLDNIPVDYKSGVILSTSLIKSVYAMDDRIFPYVEVSKGLPDSNSSVSYGLPQLDYAVVPLHFRMQLSYRDIYNRMIQWVKNGDLNFGYKPVCRIYLTSSNSLKKRAFENKSMDGLLKELLLTLPMPKFVWCIDFADTESYKNELTTCRIIIDSTSATLEEEPWIFRHDSNIIQYKDRSDTSQDYHQIEVKVAPYEMYKNNLDVIEGEA